MCETWVEKVEQGEKDMRLSQQERIILEVTELISKLMEQKNVRKSGLAARLGCSKGHITKLLDGRANMTLRTVSDVLWALDAGVHVFAGPLSIEWYEPEIVQEDTRLHARKAPPRSALSYEKEYGSFYWPVSAKSGDPQFMRQELASTLPRSSHANRILRIAS